MEKQLELFGNEDASQIWCVGICQWVRGLHNAIKLLQQTPLSSILLLEITALYPTILQMDESLFWTSAMKNKYD